MDQHSNVPSTVEYTSKTWSVSPSKIIKCQHVWVIENFSMRQESRLTSAKFSSAHDPDTIWQMVVFPRGEIPELENLEDASLGIYLRLVSARQKNRDEVIKIEAKSFFTILNRRGNSQISADETIDVYTLEEPVLGIARFIERGELIASRDLLPNDTLTIKCVLSYLATDASSTATIYGLGELPRPIVDNLAPLTINKNIGAMMHKSKMLCDVILCAKGKEFQAHKAVLASWSPVFEAMFKHETTEQILQRVDIKDINPDALERLLLIMYTGHCDFLVSLNLIQDVLSAADKYLMIDVKAMAEQYLVDRTYRWKKEDVADLLIFADLHSADRLKAEAIEFIAANAGEILGTDCWKSLKNSHPQLGCEVLDKIFLKKQSDDSDVQPPPAKKICLISISSGKTLSDND